MQALPEIFPQRPEPPDHLSEEEAAVWRAVVGRMPATWFTGEMLPLLENYCCHVCLAKDLMAEMRDAKRGLRRLEKELESVAAGRKAKLRRLIREDRKYLHDLIDMHLDQSRQVSSVATKLRLTPQSRYQPNTAGAIGPPPRKLPWEA
jgi:hypothetical protein